MRVVLCHRGGRPYGGGRMRENKAAISRMLNAVKAAPISELIGEYIALKNKGQDQYLGLCPFHAEKTPSFRVYDRRGSFKCYGCGEGGDVIAFIQKHDNTDFISALRHAAAFWGVDDAAPYKPAPRKVVVQETDEAAERRKAMQQQSARDIFLSAAPADNTLAETYLREVRKIRTHRLPGGKIPVSIRFIAAHDYWHTRSGGKLQLMGTYPAMVTAMQLPDRTIAGVHQIYLDPKTADKLRLPDPDQAGKFLPAKKMRGTQWATAIRLGHAAKHMGASEGIENGLVCMAEGGPVVWPAASLNNLAGAGIGEGEPHPDKPGRRLPTVYPDMKQPAYALPPECMFALIIKDNDSKDPKSAACLFERAGRRMAILKKTVSYMEPPLGMDLNDVVLKPSAGGVAC